MKKLITLEQLSAALAKVAALLKSHGHSAATSSQAGFLSAADKEKLDGIAAGANKYTHPTYTARTGVPTANQTPAFGGTFTVSQPVSDGTGHISAINSRTITIPNSVATTQADGLMSSGDKTKLNGIATGANKYTHPTSSGNKHIPSGGSSGQILRWGSDGTAVWGADNNTTYSPMSGATASKAGTSGLVPAPAAGKQGQFLRGDGTWATPTEAAKLVTGRTIQTNLGSTSTANFDGTANITPGVTGILPAANGGTGNTTGEASSVGSIQLTDEDLNSLSSVPGHLYYAMGGNSVTNKPSGIDNFGMFVMQTANGWYTQVLYGSDDDIWTRRWASSNWTSWVKIYSTGNKPTVSDIGAAAADHSHENATISTSGMMSASDKEKLDGYPDDLSDYSTTDEMNNAIEMAVYGAIHSFY